MTSAGRDGHGNFEVLWLQLVITHLLEPQSTSWPLAGALFPLGVHWVSPLPCLVIIIPGVWLQSKPYLTHLLHPAGHDHQ